MKRRIYIYVIYFPTSDKYYVGQTYYLQRRLFQHLNSGNLVGRAFNKHSDWQIEILHTVKDKNVANLLEIEEIRHYNCVAPNGYNLTRGGEGAGLGNKNSKGKKLSKEEIENIRKRMMGNKYGCNGKGSLKPGTSKAITKRNKENNPMKNSKTVLKRKITCLKKFISKLEQGSNSAL